MLFFCINWAHLKVRVLKILDNSYAIENAGFDLLQFNNGRAAYLDDIEERYKPLPKGHSKYIHHWDKTERGCCWKCTKSFGGIQQRIMNVLRAWNPFMEDSKLRWTLKSIVMLVEALGRVNVSRCFEGVFFLGLSLSLSITIYWQGMPKALTWATILVVNPLRHFPAWANVVAGPALVVLIMIVKHTSAENHQRTLKNKVYYSQVLESTRHAQEPHRAIMGKERGIECRYGVLSLFGLRVGCIEFRGSTLYLLI